MEKINYQGWNCYQLENDTYELYVTADRGPRILHFSFKGEENMFKIFDPDSKEFTLGDWHICGGHRLWHSPEVGARACPEVAVVGIVRRRTGRERSDTEVVRIDCRPQVISIDRIRRLAVVNDALEFLDVRQTPVVVAGQIGAFRVRQRALPVHSNA